MRLSLLLLASASVVHSHFVLPDLFAGLRPQCKEPPPCVCVCDKEPSYVAPPDRYRPPPPVEYVPPPPPPPPPPPRPAYIPPPPPPNYVAPSYSGVPPAPPMPSYNVEGGYNDKPYPEGNPNYVPEFRAKAKAA